MENLISAKKRKLNSWVVTLSLVAAAVVFYFAVFRPTETRIADLRQQIDQKRDFIESTDLMAASIAELEAEVDEATKFVKESRKVVPTEQQLPELYRHINSLMKKHDVSAERFDPGEPVAMQTLAQSPLSLAASGSFERIFRLIVGLDQLPGPTWIQNLSLKADSRNPGLLSCEASLVVFTDNSKNSD